MESFLLEAVRIEHLPGAAWCVERSDRQRSSGALGHASLLPTESPAAFDTIYDLASLTKALSTAVLAVLAHREGVLPLDRRLSGVLATLNATPWEKISLRDCLLHRTGLPAWAPLYCLTGTAEEAARCIASLPAANDPGTVLYSDLGPILAGLALERAFGSDLATLFRERVADPLQLGDTGFHPNPNALARIAPTERGNSRERELAAEFPGTPCKDRHWRQDLLHGEPHDGNARFLRGAAGHAGLFGTVDDLVRLGREMLQPTGAVLEEGEQGVLFQPATGPPNKIRCLLGECASDPASPGSPLGPSAVGHVGFTGTSFFVDPDRLGVCVLLSNRVHPADVRDVPMQTIRRQFHEAASVFLDEGPPS